MRVFSLSRRLCNTIELNCILNKQKHFINVMKKSNNEFLTDRLRDSSYELQYAYLNLELSFFSRVSMFISQVIISILRIAKEIPKLAI